MADYSVSKTLHRMYFVPHFLWDMQFEPLDLQEKTVHWLQAVPISQAEYQFSIEKGCSALDDIFERREIDVFDLHRISVI